MKVQEDGEEIVKKIVSNSETFNQKTEYSQAKYLKKKKEKYIFCFQVKKCTLEYVHKNIFLDSPAKINYFRIDVFAIFLQLCGIKPKSEILLFDNTYVMKFKNNYREQHQPEQQRDWMEMVIFQLFSIIEINPISEMYYPWSNSI